MFYFLNTLHFKRIGKKERKEDLKCWKQQNMFTLYLRPKFKRNLFACSSSCSITLCDNILIFFLSPIDYCNKQYQFVPKPTFSITFNKEKCLSNLFKTIQFYVCFSFYHFAYQSEAKYIIQKSPMTKLGHRLSSSEFS